MSETNWWVSGEVRQTRNGRICWEASIYKKRRFWFNKQVCAHTEWAESLEEARKAISVLVQRTTGIEGYRL